MRCGYYLGSEGFCKGVLIVTFDAEFSRIVREAGERRDVREAVEGIYLELGKELEKRKPLCAVSGRCCRFEEYGHRLYVTTMELGAFQWEIRQRGIQLSKPAIDKEEGDASKAE